MEMILGGLLIVAGIVTLTLWIKLDGVRADLVDAYTQIDEDEEYIEELRENLEYLKDTLRMTRAPSRRSGIINKARGG